MPRTSSLFVGLMSLCVVSLGFAPSAVAWTQWTNNFPHDPVSCTGQPPYECIAWPKTAGNSSIHVDVYADPSLGDINSVDMFTILANSRAQWNQAPALNPFLDPGNVISAIKVDTMDLGWDLYGMTTDFWDANYPYRIYRADVWMNLDSRIDWNTNLDFFCPVNYQHCHSDARKVMTHELGHAEGLGHSNFYNTAVMTQGQVTFWKPKSNDIDGLQAIYGAYP